VIVGYSAKENASVEHDRMQAPQLVHLPLSNCKTLPFKDMAFSRQTSEQTEQEDFGKRV
jgi:hypothetical protein